MQPPKKWVEVIDRVRYDLSKSELVASDAYWDGHNFERSGRNTFLYKTPKGRFFTVNLTQWQGERDTLTPVAEGEAIQMYENDLPEHEMSYEKAFPNVKVEDA